MSGPEVEAVRQAFALHQQGRLEEAECGYLAILKDHPGFAEAWHLAGALALQTGALDRAVERLGKAVDKDKRNAQYRFNYSIALQAAGRLDDAARQLRKAHALDPDNADVVNNLGLIERERGRLDAAAEALAKAAALAPARASAHNNLGLVQGAGGDAAAAEQSLRRAIALEPGFAEAHNNLGSLLLKLGRKDEAEAAYGAALKVRPDYESALFNLAGMLHSAGRDAEAAEHYRTLLAAKPDHGIARHLLNAIEGTPAAAAPAAYVKHLFDGYAGHFEDHLVGTLGYDAPAAMRLAWDETGRTPDAGATVVDLGCGTGLCGGAFRDLATTMIGVDLSERMVAAARASGHYDRVDQADAVGFLAGMAAAIDLALAGDTLIYVGDPAPLFVALATALKPGGAFLFSIEETEQPGFVLRGTGRFAHNPADLLAAAAAAGLDPLIDRPCDIRTGSDSKPIPGRIMAVARP